MRSVSIIIIILWSITGNAFTLNNNINAGFAADSVAIWVTSNSTCTNAGYSKEELLELAVEGVNRFWNSIPTSRLRLRRGGLLETSDSRYLTGALCIRDSVTTSCPSGTIPPVSEIVIACNSNSTDNFTNSNGTINKSLATTLPNNIVNGSIAGSMIIVNDTASSLFHTLNREQVVAVLAHEIGHAIGLGHSRFNENLMYYSLVPQRLFLGRDDIDGATYLYPMSFDGCGLFKGIDDQNLTIPPNTLWIIFSFILFLTAWLKLQRSKKKLVANTPLHLRQHLG